MRSDEGRNHLGQRTEMQVDQTSDRVVMEGVQRIRIDVTHAHLWDLTAVSSLDKVVLKFRRQGAEVEVLGLNHASATLVDRLGVHGKSEVLEELLAH